MCDNLWENMGKNHFPNKLWEKHIFRKSAWTVVEMTNKKSPTIFLCVHNRWIL